MSGISPVSILQKYDYYIGVPLTAACVHAVSILQKYDYYATKGALRVPRQDVSILQKYDYYAVVEYVSTHAPSCFNSTKVRLLHD